MMFGTTNRTKRIINITLEFLIVFAAFFLSGIVRVYMPFGMPYSFADTITYGYIGFLYAIMHICVNSLMGSYDTLKVDNVMKELIILIFSDVVSGVVVTSVIYVFRLEQISRIFLMIYILLLTGLIWIKRIVLSSMYLKYSQTKGLVFTAVVGCGDKTKTVIQNIGSCSDNIKLKGYFSKQEIIIQEKGLWLGGIEEIERICVDEGIQSILLVQGEVSETEMLYALNLSAKHNWGVSIIPTFSNLLASNSQVEKWNGVKALRLRLFDTSDIMGVNVAVTDMQKTVTMIQDKLEQWRGEYVCVANVHTTVTAFDDETYKNIQNGAVMVLPDGGPLSAYSREHEHQEARRVTGPDLMHYFLEYSDSKRYRHFFYGSTQETLDKMKESFSQKYPNLQICGMYSPPFRPLTEEEDTEVIKMINDASPDMLWVGLGAPKQEIWMNAHKGKINALMFGVGAAFDYEAGNIYRAPKWMQEHNLEWLYRLVQSPGRLFKRYFVTNLKYLRWKIRR